MDKKTRAIYDRWIADTPTQPTDLSSGWYALADFGYSHPLLFNRYTEAQMSEIISAFKALKDSK
mgnify:CR=1 FL=1